ncbi:MAG: serine/threonine protein kinase [Planctomycetes bacterium]|nr:serine/threonine protein kinase [Planctomycetota bacterium]
MGVVYRARQHGLDRVVALKMILAGPHASPSVVARFRAEAQAVARFQHPNLVQVFEVGEHEAMPYMALEFVDGGTLAKKIAREPQPPAFAAETVEQLARAMQYAHDRGIAHRDLKPANILIAGDGTPKITDFGLAKALEGDSGQTHSGQIMGTPSYMAPEQAEGRPDVGAPADVYALGAILYDLLTGRPPFAGSSVLDTLEMVRTREPVPPSDLTGKLPRDLETICLKCLQKDPVKRYASAADLADDLTNYLEGRPITARPVGRVERAVRWAKRNPAGAGVVVLAGFLFVVMSVAAVLLSVSEAKATDAKLLAQGEEKKAKDALEGEKAALAKEKQAVADKDAALKKETAAVIAKEQARADEEAAKKAAVANGALYAGQRNETLLTVREVLREVDGLMKGKAALAPLRLQIVNKMLARLNAVKVPDERNVLDARTEGIAYSRLGTIYFETNQIEKAAQWTNKAHTLLAKLAADSPADAVALFNVSNISHQLADVEWRLGNGARARELHVAGLKARHARVPIVEKLVKDGAIKDKDTNTKYGPGDLYNAQFQVADSHRLLGTAALRLGDPVAAVESYTASDTAFGALRTAGALDVRRLRAELQVRLGDARANLGAFDAAEKHYRAALTERETLLKITPDSAGYGLALRTDIALARTALGDFLLAARTDVTAAEALYAQAQEQFTTALKAAPDDLAGQWLVAAMNYRLGCAARQRGGFAALGGAFRAAAHFDECLRLRAALAKIDPTDVQPRVEYMLALARVGKAVEAEKLAKELLALKTLDQQTRFQAVCGLAVAGTHAADPAVAKRCKDLAFGVLAELVQTWKARGQLELDPDLAGLRADPRFAALVGAKK